MDRTILRTVRTIPAILVVLILSSCNMMDVSHPFAFFANGGSLSSDMAIASGDPQLMLDCLQSLNTELHSDSLAPEEHSQVALDMIDLLAVLSQVAESLVPYILESADTGTLDDLEDFLDSSVGDYLSRIAEENLMYHGILGKPSPMQKLWACLGVIAYAFILDSTPPFLDPGDITEEQYDQMIVWIGEARVTAAEAENEDFLALLNQLESLLVPLDPSP